MIPKHIRFTIPLHIKINLAKYKIAGKRSGKNHYTTTVLGSLVMIQTEDSWKTIYKIRYNDTENEEHYTNIIKK